MRTAYGKEVARGHKRSLIEARAAAEAVGKVESVHYACAPTPGRRPRTRGECLGGPRPCPWIDCRHHLGGERHETCCLDVIRSGGMTFGEVARIIGISRQLACVIAEDAIAYLSERFG